MRTDPAIFHAVARPVPWRSILVCLCTLLLTGCGFLLPKSDESVNVSWSNFAEAMAAFERIEPGTTTVEQLSPLGFDPRRAPNTTILTYVDLVQHFMPNPSIRVDDLDPAVRRCIEAREGCQGFRMEAGEMHKKRHGNAFLDVLNFRRRGTQTGWEFSALLLAHDGVVTYKLWGGRPNIDGTFDRRNPLGPLQSLDEVIPAVVR